MHGWEFGHLDEASIGAQAVGALIRNPPCTQQAPGSPLCICEASTPFTASEVYCLHASLY